MNKQNFGAKANQHKEPWVIGRVFWITSYVLMMVFAIATPLDVLDQYPQAKEFSDFMASWNMQIRRVGEISGSANQMNRFVYSVLWCVMPIYWFSMVVHIHHTFYSLHGPRKDAKPFAGIGGLIDLFGMAMLFYVFLALPGMANISRIGRAMFISAIGRAAYAPGCVFMVFLPIIYLAHKAVPTIKKFNK